MSTNPSRRRAPARVVALVAALSLAAMPAGAPGNTTGQASGPRARPAPAGEWVAGDLHVHTTYSHDSYGGPDDDNTDVDEFHTAGHSVEQQFRHAQARGLDFLAITDHNDVRSQDDDGFARFGVIGIPAYENSLRGHAQMLGATRIYDAGDRSAEAVQGMADALRADGGAFQVNHPAKAFGYPDDLDWSYGYDVVPDTVETWNITTAWQPPMPSAADNDDHVRYWEGWLDRGEPVAAVGASDSHWVSTSAAQGPGQPTTWVYVTDRSRQGILDGLRAGRTTISSQPPAAGAPRAFLEADADRDGVWESMVGDRVAADAALRVRVEDGAGTLLQVYTTGGAPLGDPVVVTGDRFTHTFEAPAGARWVRAEVYREDGRDVRREVCDPLVGDDTAYCRNRLVREAMTSAILLGRPTPPATGPTYARVADGEAVLGNHVVERRFSLAPFGTTGFTDRRTGLATSASPDLRLTTVEGSEITGADFHVTDATARREDGGLALTLRLEPLGGVIDHMGAGHVDRTYTVYPGVAGMRVQTTVALPGTYTGYTLDEVALPGAATTAHHFNAGYDWRGTDTPDWEPAVAPFGGAHTGDHRVTTTAGPGEAIDVTGQWLSLVEDAPEPAEGNSPGVEDAPEPAEGNSPGVADPETSSTPRAFLVLERVNYDSSHVAYDGSAGRAHVALADDLAYLGPFEGEVHLDNPTPVPVRARVVAPGQSLELESVFTGLAVDADDEPWQHHRYLADHRAPDWLRTVTFNSNGVDTNRISTGAKDDMDLAEVARQAEVARRLGVETFILDDGWQAASGDWCPDSPDCPEPRGLYPDRFPDDDFTAVRAILGDDMDLGLWMSPMQFNPASTAFRENPTWSCTPIGDALAAYNTLEPDSSSNEAGLGTWNPQARSAEGRLVDHIEGRIRRAIEEYGSRYFKFDFLAWVDCLDALDPVTAYDYRESFIAMLDRLIASHPDVTFQVDETNDYRMFPFESVLRGPTWYANGNPTASQALHNLWVLAPYVPGSAIGQSTLTGQTATRSVDYLMAAALTSHVTFFRDLTVYTDDQVEATARWIELYKQHRDRFAGMVYPLLDDPVDGDTWTALQPWDLDAQRGALLAFRQDHPDDTVTVPMRGVRGDGDFEVTDAMTGDHVGTFTADQLRAGMPVTLPHRHQAAVLLVDPAT